MPYLVPALPGDHGRGPGQRRAPTDPTRADAYADREYVDDAIAVMDAAGVDRAVLVGLSLGGRHALQLAAWYPERAAGVVAIGTALPWPLPPDFDEPKDRYEGWEKANRHYWLADYRGWVEFFMSPGLHRAALDQASGGRRRLGPGDRRRDPAAHDAGDRRPLTDGRRRGDLPGSALPGPRGARRRRRDRAVRDRCRAGASGPAGSW